MQRRKLEELSLMDDFLFNSMLSHPETGEKFTNKILKLLFNREFKNLRVSVQKVYAGMNTDLRGARLDVCIEGDFVDIEGSESPSVYDVEPDQNNAVNENLKDIQKMVDVVKRDGEVSLQYMKSFEHDQLMYEEGRLAEIKNTEREKKRADMAQSRIKELEAELKKYREKPTA